MLQSDALELLSTAFLLTHPAACSKLIFCVLTLSLPSEPLRTPNTMDSRASTADASEH
jgi:hypothetical protein